jgi:deoxyribose-phosphate aldolase
MMNDKTGTLTPESLARLIDISAVQAYHGKKEIDELISNARKYNFISVHTLPSWTAYLSEQLGDCEDILVGAPVGFPSGGSRLEVKLKEAEYLLGDGVQEMDMVINVGKMISGDFDYIRREVREVRKLAPDTPLKVILEVHYLTEDMIKRGCAICIEEGADFVKTGTGWAPSGATLEVVKLIKSFAGDAVKLKASGGIRDFGMLKQMYDLGVDRFGINLDKSIEILKECGRSAGAP